MFYVYILQSLRLEAKLYTGRSDDLQLRLRDHLSGRVWTTKRMLPVRLVFYEAFLRKEDAVRRERYLKTSKGKSTIQMMLQKSLMK